MAKAFSKKFYNSKEWQKCREYVFNRDYGLCVQCGKPGEEVHHKTWLTPDNINNPYVTLNASNLITLCKDCHHNQHKKQNETTVTGLMFNEQGELVQQYAPL